MMTHLTPSHLCSFLPSRLAKCMALLTDSRSFLSYPRHEYFRRCLCRMVGRDVEAGLLPESEMPFIRQMIADICYHNAKRYFGF